MQLGTNNHRCRDLPGVPVRRMAGHACLSSRSTRQAAAAMLSQATSARTDGKFKNPNAPAVKREAEEDWGADQKEAPLPGLNKKSSHRVAYSDR
jgi:hypothetical protein